MIRQVALQQSDSLRAKFMAEASGFLYLFEDDRPLTKARFILKVREALSHLGIDSSRYAGHSFRIGAATAAGTQGIDDSVIQMLGRWKSSAHQRCIQTLRDQLARYSALIATDSASLSVRQLLLIFARCLIMLLLYRMVLLLMVLCTRRQTIMMNMHFTIDLHNHR